MLASDEAELADLIAACRAGKLSDVAAWIEAEGPLQIDPVVRGRCAPSAALDRLSQWTRRGVWAPYERCQQPSPARAVDLSPVTRAQLHEALEKIAWEAFGDVTEQIVKEALDRIEKVAWEVIPQMAEALIQEEIRKLKAEDD